jgi:hypothetical protein
MARPVVYLRYVLFFILAASFAVQASVAAWNLQIAQLTSRSQLDAYLIFCGAFGLLVIFPIVCIDIVRKNAVFACVWFEAVWLAIFFVLETAGAAALTALLPQLSCSQQITALRDPSCKSTAVLTGITWTTTIIVLFYMTTLIICAILHQDSHPDVWRSGVRDFPWFQHRNTTERLRTPPCSPKRWVAAVTRPKEPSSQQQQTLPTMIAPKPRRNVAPPLWSTYEVEHYTAAPSGGPSGQRYSRAPAPPPAVVKHMQSRRVAPVSLYPTYMDSTIPPVAPAGLPSNTRPAGDWPATSSTSRTPRHQHRTRVSQQTTSLQQEDTSIAASPAAVSPSRRQPRGPRNRPAPLDLSQLSSYR